MFIFSKSKVPSWEKGQLLPSTQGLGCCSGSDLGEGEPPVAGVGDAAGKSLVLRREWRYEWGGANTQYLVNVHLG